MRLSYPDSEEIILHPGSVYYFADKRCGTKRLLLLVPNQYARRNRQRTLKPNGQKNAPKGSSFFNFVAVSDQDAKVKLDYRVYIGGRQSTISDIKSNAIMIIQ